MRELARAAAAHELLRRRVMERVEYYEGLPPTFYLEKLDGGLKELRERAKRALTLPQLFLFMGARAPNQDN